MVTIVLPDNVLRAIFFDLSILLNFILLMLYMFQKWDMKMVEDRREDYQERSERYFQKYLEANRTIRKLKNELKEKDTELTENNVEYEKI